MRDTAQLLADHQAIIDAWYADWISKVKAHAKAVADRRRAALTEETGGER